MQLADRCTGMQGKGCGGCKVLSQHRKTPETLVPIVKWQDNLKSWGGFLSWPTTSWPQLSLTCHPTTLPLRLSGILHTLGAPSSSWRKLRAAGWPALLTRI